MFQGIKKPGFYGSKDERTCVKGRFVQSRMTDDWSDKLDEKKKWREIEREGWMLMPGSGWTEAQRAGKKALLAVRSWASGEWKLTQGECLKLDIHLNGLSVGKGDMMGGRGSDWGRVGKTVGFEGLSKFPP